MSLAVQMSVMCLYLFNLYHFWFVQKWYKWNENEMVNQTWYTKKCYTIQYWSVGENPTVIMFARGVEWKLQYSCRSKDERWCFLIFLQHWHNYCNAIGIGASAVDAFFTLLTLILSEKFSNCKRHRPKYIGTYDITC